jgi:hypothetical protein
MLQCARIYAAVVCGTRWSSYRRRSRRGDRAVRVERDCDVIVGNGAIDLTLNRIKIACPNAATEIQVGTAKRSATASRWNAFMVGSAFLSE